MGSLSSFNVGGDRRVRRKTVRKFMALKSSAKVIPVVQKNDSTLKEVRDSHADIRYKKERRKNCHPEGGSQRLPISCHLSFGWGVF